MTKSTVIDFARPSDFSPDPLTDLLRAGAQELLATAVRAEVTEFMKGHAHLLDDEGRQRLVRHGFLPEREIMTGIGKVAVEVPRVRDRGANADGSKVRFNSSLVPPYLRKAKSVEELLPWLYLKGISTGDFSEALASLVGPDADGLSASTITRLERVAPDWIQVFTDRTEAAFAIANAFGPGSEFNLARHALKATWWNEYEAWRKRDLTGKRYVYIWADGVYFNPRLDDDRQCMLVIIGAPLMVCLQTTAGNR